MSHIHEGPIASYNSLHDGHLSAYFGSTRIRKHLVKAGLITKDGRLVSEDQYRLLLARREHKRMMKDMISQAIVQRTLEVERQRQAEIKKKLEEIAKLELVKRVRASRGRRGDEEVLQFLLPLPTRDSRQNGTAARRSAKSISITEEEGEDYRPPSDHSQDETYVRDRNFDSFAHLKRKHGKSVFPKEKIEMYHWTNLDRNAIEEYNDMTKNVDALPALAPYNQPDVRPRFRRERSNSPKRRPPQRSALRQSSLHRPGSLIVLHEAKVKSLCEVTMKFLGLGPTSGPASAFHEVSIDQQHCGGNTLTVFKGKLSEGDVFTFVSRRHLDFPFSLTVYVDNVVDCRLSSCCEYKHRCGKKLGGSHGHFRLLEVRGASACYKCQMESGRKEKEQNKDSEEESSSDDVDFKSRPVPPIKEKLEKKPSPPSSQKRRSGQVIRTAKSESVRSEQIESSRTFSARGEQSDTVVIASPSGQNVVVRLPDSDSRSESSARVEKMNAVVRVKVEVKSADDQAYADDKFEDDEDEPDRRSAVVTSTNETSSSKVPKPPVTHASQVVTHVKHSESQNNQTSINNSSNLLSTLAQVTGDDSAYADKGKNSAPITTTVVKLHNKPTADESDSFQVKQLSFQQTTSTTTEQVTVQSLSTVVGKRDSVTIEEMAPSSNSSAQHTPLMSPMTPPEQADIMSPQQSSGRTVSSILKKSVSFNEVRLERQISDEERYSPEMQQHNQVAESQPNIKSSESDDEEEDPNAVTNHEAALLLEEQQRAAEDKTPFLQPGATVLDINKQTLSDRQVRRLCAEIHNSDKLEKIVIRESGLNDGMVQRICDALANSTNAIRLLCLNLNAISAAGIVHVVQLLHSKPSIKMLLLYGNPLGDNGLNALVDGIFGDLPEDLISSLAAQGINIPPPKEDEPVRISLTHLDLGEIGLSSAGAIKFSKLLDRLPSLRVLNLGGNHNVGLEGWSAISKSLSDKSYPAKLCLSHCRLGNKCTAELATALRTNSGVENIDLEGCGIGEEGGRALLDLVNSEPRKLENIVLSDNRIPDRLLHLIEQGLKKLRGEDEEADD